MLGTCLGFESDGDTHSIMQCSSSCIAVGVRHQGHALCNLGTLGVTRLRRFNVEMSVDLCAV
jgi:hypothetical protein